MNLVRKNRIKGLNKIILLNAKDKLREQVTYLKTLPNPPQRSDEWFTMRKDKITASMIAPILKVGSYGSRKEKIGEKSGNLSSTFTGNFFTNWGTDFEDTATKIYEQLYNVKVNEFSLIGHPIHKFLGASPDGITDDGTMLEIKCPPKRVITGVVPDYYMCQIQLQLEVCDLEVCEFLECKFSKYRNRKEFLNDNDFHVNINFGEKFENIHCDEFLDNGYTIFKGIREKSNYELREDEYEPNVYWKLEKMSCVQVKRNREWFSNVLPELQKAWEEIEFYREHPEEWEKKYPPKKPVETIDLWDEIKTSKEEVNDLADML